MTHLLSISIGPVQDFIAAARRTADLYAGSQILQELSKEAARYLHSNDAKLRGMTWRVALGRKLE